MSEIAILVPIEELMPVALEACEKAEEDITVKMVHFDEAAAIARKFAKEGTEVIISRGTLAMKIIELDIGIPVVQIPITGFDLLRTIMKAYKNGEKIGIADDLEVIHGIESIEASLGFSIEKYVMDAKTDVGTAVQTLIERNIDVLIGKSVYVNQVKKLNVNTVILSSGVESVSQAIHEAKSLLEVRRTELKRTKQLQAILDFIADGVIAVDENGIITVCNPSARKILNITNEGIIGKPVDHFLVHSRLKEVISSGKEELNKIQDENGVKIIANRIPIRHENSVFGAVCTFQELKKLQQQEQEIRKKLMHRGHVTKYHEDNIVGESEIFIKAIDKAKKYAQVDSTVLLSGETGVGKEVFAQLIHRFSKRAEGPFVAVNCAAIPLNLLESELFGYVEGAFTGAKKGGKTGLFELAHQGTIFLDEIGELAESLQAQLLRVLQEGEVMRLGDERVIPIDIRVIAASNRDLGSMVDEGKFRADLYYRLDILNIMIPSLNERREDIPLLCNYFTEELKKNIQKDIAGFTNEAVEILQNYHWPGNIRQLRNIVERCIILAEDNFINEETVMAAGGKDFLDLDMKRGGLPKTNGQYFGNLPNDEHNRIVEVLKRVNGNKTEAAKILGIGRTTLWRKIKENEVERYE
ncbi:sigma 54-interacting transcriptional regulator [Peribacillus glennii]|uniref:PAS domain-containing protein n=1 Tax=Peribacillus glennii TaxID=2303991 RepID=A0A372LG23_9BACI|nr:sigma 54-interacting transcriptional regulator [Peribacillus glennii]RFU65248.1 PAS domain-containing protein [Peribacillus glennii]